MISFFEKLAASVLQKKNPVTTAMLDEHRAAFLLNAWKRYHDSNKDASIFTNELIHSMDEEFYNMPSDERAGYIANSIDEHILDMFTKIHNSRDSKSNFRSMPADLYKDYSYKPESLKNAVGFQLDIKQSTIPNAGRGVFMNTSKELICPGTLVALYPGTVHLKEHMRSQKDLDKLLPDDDFMIMFRTDGIVIDGRETHKVNFNPYACAHLFNHVPPGWTPNVAPILYDFPAETLMIDGFPDELRHYIPNRLAKPPSIAGAMERLSFNHTIVFLASRWIADGEEIVFDYRLNPLCNTLPSWYESYDVLEARRRWATSPEQIAKIEREEAEGDMHYPVFLRSNHGIGAGKKLKKNASIENTQLHN